jgi:hypothetical protein
LFGRFSSDFHRLELAILTIQKKEPNVSVWSSESDMYHFRRCITSAENPNESSMFSGKSSV